MVDGTWRGRLRPLQPALCAAALIAALAATPPAAARQAPPVAGPERPSATAPAAGPHEVWRAYDGDPPGGFRYRLTIGSGASPGSPHRLVIWLHPSGTAANSLPESLLPTFVKRGFALLVITRKQFSGWTDLEARNLLSNVLPDAAKVPGVDPNRPILLGFSAGGQLALALWRSLPSRFGGIIVDAAYPLDEKDGAQALMEPPADPGARSVPLYAAVGADDTVAQTWKKVEPSWIAAGVPLTIRWVAGAKHEWLFSPTEISALEEWLGSPALASPGIAPPAGEPAPAARP